jgi:hypothetical protein
METVTLKKDELLKAFNEGSDSEKKLLTALYPSYLTLQKITDRVKTFEDARWIVKPSPSLQAILDYKGVDPICIMAQALAKIAIITEALNEGWKPDFNDSTQYKWYPYFRMDSPGFRFNDSYYAIALTSTGGGSRLCFKSEELARYAGTQFFVLYGIFLC